MFCQALTMSNDARRSTTTGEVANLMSVDAERLRDASSFLWLLWSCPLQIIVALVFLYMVLGVSIFAGFGIMLILFPINLVVASIESKLEVRCHFWQLTNICVFLLDSGSIVLVLLWCLTVVGIMIGINSWHWHSALCVIHLSLLNCPGGLLALMFC